MRVEFLLCLLLLERLEFESILKFCVLVYLFEMLILVASYFMESLLAEGWYVDRVDLWLIFNFFLPTLPGSFTSLEQVDTDCYWLTKV